MNQTSRPSSRSEGKAWTRQQVLRSARRVFAERGYEGASITEIAKLADVAVGSVYGHFSTKRDLFWAVMQQRMDDDGGAAADLAQADQAQFLTAMNANLAATSESVEEVSMLAEIWLNAFRDEDFRAGLRDNQAQVKQLAAGIIRGLRGRPEVRWQISDEELAVVATALFRGLSQARYLDPAAVPPDLFTRCLLPLLTLEDPAGDTPAQDP